MRAVTPILDESLVTAIENAVVMFKHKAQWKSLGMDKLREQGAALLFHGMPGTGKTITARFLTSKLKLTMQEMDFSMIGSDTPGELARNIKKLFMQARQPDNNNNPSLVFLDECDTLLVSRARLGHSTLWMLEPINALLREIGNYPGLVILATNQKPEFLDFALQRRLIGEFEFAVPDFLTRVKLWKAKWPSKLPLKLEDIEAENLSQYELTGANIETALIQWVSNTLRLGDPFKFEDLKDVLRKNHNIKIQRKINIDEQIRDQNEETGTN
jgi:AAA+ superfamily predicted ATPase